MSETYIPKIEPGISDTLQPKYKGKYPLDEIDKKLLKFVRRVTDRIHGKIKGVTTDDPEYWGFACIFRDELNVEDATYSLDLLNAMPTRKHFTEAQLQKKMKAVTDEEKANLSRILDKLSYFGMLEYDYGDRYTKDGPLPDTQFIREKREY